MSYEIVENLTEEQILKEYNEIIETDNRGILIAGGSNWRVTCTNGRSVEVREANYICSIGATYYNMCGAAEKLACNACAYRTYCQSNY